jgi:hypothetical protein
MKPPKGFVPVMGNKNWGREDKNVLMPSPCRIGRRLNTLAQVVGMQKAGEARKNVDKF